MDTLLFKLLSVIVGAIAELMGGARLQRSRARKAAERGQLRGALRVAYKTVGKGPRTPISSRGSWTRGVGSVDARGLLHKGHGHTILGVDLAGTNWPKGYSEEIGAGGVLGNALWFSPSVTVFRMNTPEGRWTGQSSTHTPTLPVSLSAMGPQWRRDPRPSRVRSSRLGFRAEGR